MAAIAYKLCRSRRKTLAIHVDEEGVVVKVPYGTSQAEIDRFVSAHAEWIRAKWAQWQKRTERFLDVLQGKAFLLFGKPLPILQTPRKTPLVTENGIHLPPNVSAAALQRAYRKYAQTVLFAKIQSFSMRTGLTYADVRLSNAKTKWGSCDTKNRIRLGWRLVLLPEELADYVVVHELSHTVHHNHSRAFWALVEEHCKGYREARKCLKEYGILSALYA